MKILQICSARWYGGGEVHVLELIESLRRRGHQVEAAVRAGSEIEKRLALQEIALHPLPFRSAVDLTSAWKLGGIWKKGQFELAHSHTGRDYLISCLAKFRVFESRLILTRQLLDPPRRNRVTQALYRKQVDRFIVTTRQMRQRLLSAFDFPPERVVQIPNWVDLTRFASMPDRAAARRHFQITRPLAIGMLGQISPHKGQEDFIRAAALLSRRFSDLEFFIAGAENDPLQPCSQSLQRLVQQLELGGRIHFYPFLDNVVHYLAALDIFVLPSWEEPFGIVLLEAMAAGIPVVATRSGGPLEILAHHTSPVYAQPRDPHSLADAMEALIRSPELRKRLSREGLQMVRAYDKDQVMNQLEETYSGLLQRSPVS
ncbi:MAG: glycosyltransferase family 4 protein [Acidobacteriota bacterium]